MTRPARLAASSASAVDRPLPDTPVLLHRKLNLAIDPGRRSVFGDDRWDLTPGLFEAHAVTCRLNFLPVPNVFRDPAKHYIWQLINHEQPRRLRGTRGTRLALRTVSLVLPRLTAFLDWMDAHRIGGCAEVTTEQLDRYLADVITTEATTMMKASLLIEVRRLWPTVINYPNPCVCQPRNPGKAKTPKTCSADTSVHETTARPAWPPTPSSRC